ncbi:MAG: hypothetical protein M0R21_05745 [Lentimicrobiaceae bacterium]|nr:hypothetical protein [Lentimicrobiaceae bacterium]
MKYLLLILLIPYINLGQHSPSPQSGNLSVIRHHDFSFHKTSQPENEELRIENHIFNPHDSLITPLVKIATKNREIKLKYHIINDLFYPSQAQFLRQGDSVQLWVSTDKQTYHLLDIIDRNTLKTTGKNYVLLKNIFVYNDNPFAFLY